MGLYFRLNITLICTFHLSRPLVSPIKTQQMTFPIITGSICTPTVPDDINIIHNSIWSG